VQESPGEEWVPPFIAEDAKLTLRTKGLRENVAQ
jgi:hypothetical protein